MEFQFTGNHTLRFDKTLTGLDLDAGQEQRALLRRLEWAASRLDAKRIGHVIPAVGLNIASCIKGAFQTDEVAAFPGRITLVDGALRHHETPAFGTSKHLAELLLAAHAQDESKVSAMNILPPLLENGVDVQRIEDACTQLGYSFGMAPKGKLEAKSSKHDLLLDEGGLAIERGDQRANLRDHEAEDHPTHEKREDRIELLSIVDGCYVAVPDGRERRQRPVE